MMKWLRCYWDEEDIWFYFELDPDGQVIRQVALQESERTPLNAAALDEWQRAEEIGRLAEYEAEYGLTAELPFQQWEGHDPEWLSADEFEGVWTTARQQITARPTDPFDVSPTNHGHRDTDAVSERD
ncbi:hypothetical protein [Streptosporangium sp. KLBMP 9127]|nr:hypothetical protein [Streptosporangium sp. KLBMP 9127]